ncbi:MAG: hypothetical protein AAB439_03310 [Patescibacteria group bacterium]
MSELTTFFKHSVHTTNYYFGGDEASKTKTNVSALVWALAVGAGVAVFIALEQGDVPDGDDQSPYGTDRAAGEDEAGRKVRERGGGRDSGEVREYRSWMSMSNDELLAYYHEHYEGLSRGKLAQLDENFYSALRRRGLIDEIPFAQQNDWASMSDQQLLDYYHDRYEGVSRGKLREVDQNLYHALWKRGLLDEIPTARELKEEKQ